MSPRPAAFLDRDGSIIKDTGFVRDPKRVRLITGSGDAIARLNAAGWAVVVVTNQSGIARGMLTETDYRAVARRTDELLAAAGAWIDASYMCPHYPEITGPCDCRKPGLAHYRAAIEALEIDPSKSLFAGDRLSDLLPAKELGGRGILLLTGEGRNSKAEARAAGFTVAKDLLAAVKLVTIRIDD
jgi:D-glycero-D-manno-heptose 1,7-bisphosphate phosphatase